MSFVECLASSRLNGSLGFVREIPGEHSPDDTSILVGACLKFMALPPRAAIGTNR
jgi:hypothetical protein